MQRTAKRLAGQSGFVRRPAKGTAASTSSQPQAVIDSSADTSVPLASRLAGGENLEKSSSIGHTFSNEAVLTRATPDMNQSAPGVGTPTGDFWKRSGQHEPRMVPGHGAPLIKAVFQKVQVLQRSHPDQSDNRHEPKRSGSGYPTGGFWKRSGQHEPRRGPGHGARSCSEVVFCQIGMPERSRLSAGADIRTKLPSEEDYRV